MDAITKLEKLIKELLSPIHKPRTDNERTDIDTRLLLFNLASSLDWREGEIEKINLISKSFDINKKFLLAYHNNNHKVVASQLSDPVWLELAAALFLKALLLSLKSSDSALQLKRYNVLFKLLDLIQPEWIAVDTFFEKHIMDSWTNLIENLKANTEVITTPPHSSLNSGETITKRKTIPLTVLFYEGPISRAYLETINRLGLKPQRIIELVAAKDIVTKKPVGRFLPKVMRTDYASSIQKNKIHYWPKNLSKTQPEFVSAISAEIQEKFGFSKQCIDDANSLKSLSDYSDDIDSLLIDGLNDPILYQYLSQQPESALLFTGGGLVHPKLLSLQHLRFLHIHPGFLPDMRGADCALWSTLLTGHTSATCFYLSPGIDTGNIIHAHWLPKISLSTRFEHIERKSIYRAVYGFVDPWVRSFALRDLVVKNDQFLDLSSYRQDENMSNTFHFMNYQLRQASFDDFFTSN